MKTEIPKYPAIYSGLLVIEFTDYNACKKAFRPRSGWHWEDVYYPIDPHITRFPDAIVYKENRQVTQCVLVDNG